VRLLFEELFLGAEPVLFVLAGFAATTFIEFVGPFPNLVLWRSIVWHHRQLGGRVFRCNSVLLRLLENLRIEHWDTSF